MHYYSHLLRQFKTTNIFSYFFYFDFKPLKSHKLNFQFSVFCFVFLNTYISDSQPGIAKFENWIFKLLLLLFLLLPTSQSLSDIFTSNLCHCTDDLRKCRNYELGKTVEIENWDSHQTVETRKRKSKLSKNVENWFLTLSKSCCWKR
jgi:hypothetical protein